MKVTITIEDGDDGVERPAAASRPYIKGPYIKGPSLRDPARGRTGRSKLDIATLEKLAGAPTWRSAGSASRRARWAPRRPACGWRR